jgi:outer membrane protein assembly factor BamB
VRRSPSRLRAAGLLILVSTLSLAAASNWPQFRGPAGQGVSDETGLPLSWSASSNVAWKSPIPGRGHSSPIVWGRHVFLTTAIEGEAVPGHQAAKHIIEGQPYVHPDSMGADRRHSLIVMAFDTETGRELWRHTAYEGPMFDGRHRRGSFASATPVTDGQAVYVFFGSEGAYAYDFDGRQLWRADVGKIKTIGMGTASSPVLYQNLIILQCDEDEGKESFIAALDKRTGKEVWRTGRAVQASWSTPVLVEAPGRMELVTNGYELIIAYDPRTGRELWRTKGIESNAIHTPVVGGGLVIVTGGFPAKRTLAIRPGGSGDVTATHVAWTYAKGTAYVASPIVYGDYLYLISDSGLLTCLDVKTGEVRYDNGRPPKPARFMGSPVAFDGRLLLTSSDGDTFVVKAGPTFELLHTNSLGEAVYGSPALAGGRILLRGEEHLYCLRAVAGRRPRGGQGAKVLKVVRC